MAGNRVTGGAVGLIVFVSFVGSAVLLFVFQGTVDIENANTIGSKQLKRNAVSKDPTRGILNLPSNVSNNGTTPSSPVKNTQFVVDDHGDRLPRGLRLAFIGDSLIRFQYLSLLFYLHHGHWEPPGTFPSIVAARDINNGNWYDYFNFSTSMFVPKERCDCFRLPKINQTVQTENRYYYDPIRDNLVVLVFKAGLVINAKGHISANDALDGPFFTFPQQGPFQWNYSRWEDILRLHLGQLSTRPRYVILNQGLSRHSLHNLTVRDEIATTLKEMNMVGMYRTISRKGFKLRPLVVPEYEADMCRKLDMCLNISWTWDLGKSSYLPDAIHYREPVYRRINEQMLAMIRDYEDGIQSRPTNGEVVMTT